MSAVERVMCPLCRAIESAMVDNAVTNADEWRCARCGQVWSAGRVATVAAYTGWASDRVNRLAGQS